MSMQLTKGQDICLGLIHLVVSLMQLPKTGIDEPGQVWLGDSKGLPASHELFDHRYGVSEGRCPLAA